MDGISAYPLQWPEGEKRTPLHAREWSRFGNGYRANHGLTFNRERRLLLDEIERLMRGDGYRHWKMDRSRVVISTNLPLRQDGEARAGARTPEDQGVAVYFELDGKRMCFACDRWMTLPENVRAIWKTIEAIRAMDRYGVASASNRAFTGFEALPPPIAGQAPWWEIFGIPAHTPTDEVIAVYRGLRSAAHPDRGGSTERFNRIVRAFEAFQAERGLA